MPITRESLCRSTPEAQGISSSALINFIDEAEQSGLELHSLMLLRHGHVVAEGWWLPYAPQYPHMLYSLSKSFAATAAGLARAEEYFSLDDTVLSFFPDDAPAVVSENLAAMRVRHLLSMSTGHAEDTTAYLSEQQDGNWVKAFLSRPVEHEPGTHFLYNSGATYMISAIVQKVTGSTLLDFLQPRLFSPLGTTDATWESCPRGINVGGWGLNLKTEDIARFGQLYLQKGVWEDKRLLPESWVEEATTSHVSNGTHEESDWEQGYGYQFWRCRHNAYRADGAFGQFCVVMPDQDAVLAITSNLDMQALLNLVWDRLLPALECTPLSEDRAAQEKLIGKLASLSIAALQGQHTSHIASQVSGKTYHFAENDQTVKAITFDFGAEEFVLSIHDACGVHRVAGGYGAWHSEETTYLQRRVWSAKPPQEGWRLAAMGTWTAQDTFTARLCFYEAPFSPTITCRFLADSRLLFDLQGSIGFGPTERAQLEGRVA